jgi:hypothetical protein
MKNNLLLRLLLLLVVLLVGSAMMSAQSQIILGGGSQGVAMDIMGTSSAQLVVGQCNGSSCASGGNGVITNSKGSAVSLGTWNLVLSGSPLTVSSTGALDGSPTGTFTFQGNTGETGTVTGTAIVTSVVGSSSPQLNITVTNLTGTGNLASSFPQGGAADLSYVANGLVCTSSVTGACAFENLLAAAAATADGGNKYGRLAPESETTAAFLLGTGLFGLALVLRRRHKLTHTEA